MLYINMMTIYCIRHEFFSVTITLRYVKRKTSDKVRLEECKHRGKDRLILILGVIRKKKKDDRNMFTCESTSLSAMTK